MKNFPERIVLAYSGGLDTSVMLHWLVQQGYDVVAYCADVGQGPELDTIIRRANAAGASDVVIDDLCVDFAQGAILPAMHAQARYEQQYLLGTALARPIIAMGQIACARQTGATAVAHGATGKGNDQIRFELAYRALAPHLQVVAPWRTWSFEGRANLMAYAQEHGLEVPVSIDRPYSSDRNLMHVSYEGGVLEDPWVAPSAGLFELTVDPSDAPRVPRELVLEFVAGVPVAVDGEWLPLVDLIGKLNNLAGGFGVGRLDVVENRVIGLKSRGVYETPGVTVLYDAWRALQSLVFERATLAWVDGLGVQLANQVYDGLWFAPECMLVKRAIADASSGIDGEVRVRLSAGAMTVTGRRAADSGYNRDLASFEVAGGFDQADAGGFIRLTGLRLGSSRTSAPSGNAEALA